MSSQSAQELHLFPSIVAWLRVLVLVYLLLVAVVVIGEGFKFAAGSQAEQLFKFAKNPLLGLMVGIVFTALIQSSSTVTSIIVGLVAGGLPVSIAVPMVMGANIGTSVTNTLVSLGHVRDEGQFRLAFSAATILDMFNLLAVAILLPIELMVHLLERISQLAASVMFSDVSLDVHQFNLLAAAVNPAADVVQYVTRQIPSPWAGICEVLVGITLIIGSITRMSILLKRLMVGTARDVLQRMIGQGPLSGILSGTIATVLVQSSSTTTSLMVPLAGGGILTLKQIYPFTLGANIGTCITALIAAAAVTGESSRQALAIALVHLFFNCLGVAIIYGVPFLRPLPVTLAESLGDAVSHQKSLAFVYVIGIFFVVPGFFLGISWLLGF